MREAGYPAEAVRAYLEELAAAARCAPRSGSHRSLGRRLASLDDPALAERWIPVEAVPLVRGAHDLVEAGELARGVLDPPSVESTQSPETLARFAELRSQMPDVLDKDEAKALQRELKAVGGNLRALRVALTGRDRGPELWAVLRALPRDEALRRALT